MHSIAVDWMGVGKDGPGDSALRISATCSRRLSTAVFNEAPQISQFGSEGWFWYVHRGHDSVPPEDLEAGPPLLLSLGGAAGAGLFEMAAMAALTRCMAGGLMPQARHGGIGVREASAGSKLEGTGLEKEQMGQTQEALRDGAGAGLFRRSGEAEAGLAVMEAARPRVSWLAGLGKRVILGEDLRKPAYEHYQSLHGHASQTDVHRSRASPRLSGRWQPSCCAARHGPHNTRDGR